MGKDHFRKGTFTTETPFDYYVPAQSLSVHRENSNNVVSQYSQLELHEN